MMVHKFTLRKMGHDDKGFSEIQPTLMRRGPLRKYLESFNAASETST